MMRKQIHYRYRGRRNRRSKKKVRLVKSQIERIILEASIKRLWDLVVYGNAFHKIVEDHRKGRFFRRLEVISPMKIRFEVQDEPNSRRGGGSGPVGPAGRDQETERDPVEDH